MRPIYACVKQKWIAPCICLSIVAPNYRLGGIVYEFLHDLSWVVDMRSESLTSFFKAVTWFGYTTFYMIFLSIGFWLWSYRKFTRLAVLIAVSGLLNAYLKDFWQDPRPVFPPSLDGKAAESFGLPSGHAQISATLWIWLCLEMRKGWLWFVGIVMVGLICLSRLYLAVHDVEDILGGLAIAAVLIVGFWNLPLRTYVSSRRPLRFEPIIALILFQAALIATWPGPHGAGAAAGLGGFALAWLVGADLARRAGCRRPDGFVGNAILAVVGIAGLFALYAGATKVAEAVDPDGWIALYVGTILVGLYISLIPPLIYQKLRRSPVAHA